MEHDNEKWQFQGFSNPNTTSIPDEYFDFVSPRLNGSEVKVMNYLMRRTYGFKKDSDMVSISQMLYGIVKKNGERLDEGTGLSKKSVLKALNSLEKKHLIIRRRQFDFKGGNLATSYEVNRQPTPLGGKSTLGYVPLGGKSTQGGLGGKSDQALAQNSPKPLGEKGATQVTVNNIQLDNNVNVASKNKKGRNILHRLNDAQQEEDHVRLIANDILAALGDKRSEKFYLLVARKVPERMIRRTLSELKEGRAKSPERVFTNLMMQYAQEALETDPSNDLKEQREALAKRFKDM